MRVAKHVWTVGLAIAVALLFTTDCGKKPKPGLEPGAVPVEAPEEAPPPEGAESPDEGPDVDAISLLLKDIYFDYDEDALRQDAKEILNANADVMMDNSWVNILIEGHCDERGTVEYNLALGEKRALAAKRYLVTYGVDASRVSIISYGKERPVAFGHDESSWAKNRRAHFAVK